MMTKRRKTSLEQQQTNLTPSLPDDLLLSVFARISKLYYPSLSLVSKKFRTLLTSPELYKTRALLGHTEKCLYIPLDFPPHQNPRWFTLCHKPTINNNNKKKKSSGYVLAKLPIQNPPQAQYTGSGGPNMGLGVVSVGSSIYIIGGPINGSPSSNICALDCQSHTWSEAPSMSVDRSFPKANVVDGKIYVGGGCKESDSSKWMEVFDTETGVWENVLSPQRKGRVNRTAVIGGRIYYMFNGGLVYKPREGKWETIGWSIFESGWCWLSYCVVDNVLYCNSDKLKWYDSKRNWWTELKGLKGLPKFASYGSVKLADYGGKLAVFWTKYFRASGYKQKRIWCKYFRASGYKQKRIWCAVIEVERREDDQMWADVEWFEPVLTVPNSFQFVGAPLAGTV